MVELRRALGSKQRAMKQEAMAALLGVSRTMIASIETGAKPLNKKIADRAAAKTGVDPDWLMEKGPAKPIKTLHRLYVPGTGPRLNDYGSVAEYFQSNEKEILVCCARGGHPMEALVHCYQANRLFAVLESAVNKGQRLLFSFKLGRFLDELESEFGADEKLRSAFERAVRRGGGSIKLDKLKSIFQIQPLFKSVSALLLRKKRQPLPKGPYAGLPRKNKPK